MINTSRGVCNDQDELTGGWKDKTKIVSVTDGLSNTILAGEMHIPRNQLNRVPFNGPMFNGQELVAHTRIGGPGAPLLSTADEGSDLLGFGSAHAGVTNFVFADGSTTSVSNFLDTVVLGNLCHRSDGELVSLEQ